jgi:hypothetical protein
MFQGTFLLIALPTQLRPHFLNGAKTVHRKNPITLMPCSWNVIPAQLFLSNDRLISLFRRVSAPHPHTPSNSPFARAQPLKLTTRSSGCWCLHKPSSDVGRVLWLRLEAAKTRFRKRTSELKHGSQGPPKNVGFFLHNYVFKPVVCEKIAQNVAQPIFCPN